MAENNKIQVGFKETKEAIDFAIALGQGIEASLEDHKLTLADLPNFLLALTEMFDAIENIEEVPFEFAIASPEEVAELKAYVNTKLDLTDDQLEAFIEDAFKIMLDIFMLFRLYFAKKNDINESEAVTE